MSVTNTSDKSMLTFVLKSTVSRSSQAINFVKKNQDSYFRNWLVDPVSKMILTEATI